MEQHKAETANRKRRQGSAEDKADKDGKQTLDAMGGKQALEGKDTDGRPAVKVPEGSGGQQRTRGRRVGRAPGRLEACKVDMLSKILPIQEELPIHGLSRLEVIHPSKFVTTPVEKNTCLDICCN